jgi:nucleoside phosphorylase
MESAALYFLGFLYDISTLSILGVSDIPDSINWNFQKSNNYSTKHEFIIDNTLDVLQDVLPVVDQKVYRHENTP